MVVEKFKTTRIKTKSLNEKRAVHNITVYCEERYAERKNKEKSCYTDFQETDFRVLA